MPRLMLEADIEFYRSCSVTTYEPVQYEAGAITCEAEVLPRFHTVGKPGLSDKGDLTGFRLTGARLYDESGRYVLGGYFDESGQAFRWVPPVVDASARMALANLAGLMHCEANDSDSGQITRRAAQILALGLVDLDSKVPEGFALTGKAPERIALHRGVYLKHAV